MPIALPPLPSIPPITTSPETAAATSGANGPSVQGTDFMTQLGQAIDGLQQQQTTANTQALGVANGTGSISDFMVTAEQANLQTELADTVAQKATAAFNLIMDMQF
ncbi:MAG TPA: flagellar hook-basal body complex protein FliE [Acidimicrobiales bacterium]|nr:flagellar hook-basal body complex protein FliE [Acidimicrobiales bacterium]